MILNFFERVGDKTFSLFFSTYEALYFGSLCLVSMFIPSSYNSAMRSVLVRQIYFTTIQILPMFTIMGLVFGTAIVGSLFSLALEYSLQEHIGNILVGFVMNEFAPFFTVLLISLRSGAAIATEIAVMKVNKELNTLESFHISLINYLFLPRIISGMLSLLSLSVLLTLLMFFSGFGFSFFILHMNLDSYLSTLVYAISISDIVYMSLKSLAFGFVTMLIPIYSGLKTMDSFSAIPISVLQGMVRLFISIFIIEVLSLILKQL